METSSQPASQPLQPGQRRFEVGRRRVGAFKLKEASAASSRRTDAADGSLRTKHSDRVDGWCHIKMSSP